MSEITYDDKVDLQVATNIANINKVTASDMNEIKNVVNGNAEEVGDITSLTTTDKTSVVNAVNELNAPEKWVSVGTTAPTDGRRVWFKKGKNLINLNNINVKQYVNRSGGLASSDDWSATNYIQVQPNTTYILSGITNSGTTAKICFYSNQDVSSFISAINSTKYTFTTPNNANYVRLSLNSETPTSAMLEEGSTATSYEPYIEPSINVDNEEWYSKPKVLWTNPSPANNFASQLITLVDNLSNYKYYEVIYRHHKTLNIYSSTGKVLSSDFALLMSSRFINATREVTAIGTGTITFGHSTDFLSYGSSTATNNNDRNIPIQILGYK